MIKINCQSSIKLIGSKNLYFDPIKQNKENDADYIFITHTHWDHFNEEDILKIKKDSTKIIGPKDIEETCIKIGFSKENIILLNPEQEIKLDDINIKTVRAYNINKDFHPKENNWLGYIINFDNKTYYIPGDTDVIPEMNDIKKIDVCFIPIGGTYTMNAKEASDIVKKIKPKKVIPIHYGMVVGTKEDLILFEKSLGDIKIEELINL